MPTSNEFSTTNALLAAFLHVKGHPLLRIICTSGFRASFVFSHTPELDADRTSFFTDSLVPAQTYAITLRDLKGRAVEAVKAARVKYGYRDEQRYSSPGRR